MWYIQVVNVTLSKNEEEARQQRNHVKDSYRNSHGAMAIVVTRLVFVEFSFRQSVTVTNQYVFVLLSLSLLHDKLYNVRVFAIVLNSQSRSFYILSVKYST